MEQISDEARLIIEWAEEIIQASDTGRPPKFPRIPPRKYASMLPDEAISEKEIIRDTFEPGFFTPGPLGIRSLVVDKLTQRYPTTSHEEFLPFADKMNEMAEAMDKNEHWVIDPLTDDELVALHSFAHDALEKLAEMNDWYEYIDYWKPEDKLLAQRIFIALSYLLAWQKYSRCVLFLSSMASPWICQMSEAIAEYIDAPEMLKIKNEMFCTKRRYNHFENIVYGYGEGGGSSVENLKEDTTSGDAFDFEED